MIPRTRKVNVGICYDLCVFCVLRVPRVLGAAKRIIGGNIAQDVDAGTVSLCLSTYIDAAARRFRVTDIGGCDMPAS